MIAEPQSKFVFVGLGNPGKKYAKTRHNIGFYVIEELARSLGWLFQDDRRFSAKVAKHQINEAEVHLLLPMTYMNLSGWSVKQYVDYYKLSVNRIVVVCDDIVLAFGQMRLRRRGSAGGHNGLKSIILNLGTEEFTRLRMGIGSPFDEQDLADYVLTDFSAQETTALDEFVKRGIAVLKSLTNETITDVMNRANRPVSS